MWAMKFDANQIAQLIQRLPQTLQDLESDLHRLGEFLDAAGHADEQPN